MFQSVLVANRGEIAVRIVRTLSRMGIRAVVAASIPDRRSLAVHEADDWILLRGYSASETYLDQEAIIAAAREKGCDAIHPGYGFLSENPDFAEACLAAGITFIGPPPAVLRSLGDKSTARALAIVSHVPVVPGWDGDDSEATLVDEATRIGYPVMLKARAGGGGRGMRVVHDHNALIESIISARREAESAFGDGRLFLEKLVTSARHVEVQVLADSQGNIVHLGERDCSVQRRHQKLIEETPSPVVDASLRAQLTSSAVRLMRAAGYVNAGTVEFLVGEPGPGGVRPFYFLEVNPRLQVEHPVTEAVTGLDLVELQLRTAAGEPIPFSQDEIPFEGHAIECRINAEDPGDGFKPSSGRLLRQDLGSPDNRVDIGYAPGDAVPAFYDSLLAKVVIHRPTRAEAVTRAVEILSDLAVEGVSTNAALHAAILQATIFRDGEATTGWIEQDLAALLAAARIPLWAWAAAALALATQHGGAAGPGPHGGLAPAFHMADQTGAVAAVTVQAALRGFIVEVAGVSLHAGMLTRSSRGQFLVRVESQPLSVEAAVDGSRARVRFRDDDSCRYHFRLAPPPPLPRRQHAAAEGVTAVVAPLAGTVVDVRVAPGDLVEVGQLLAVLEAMKMEHRLTASAAGAVKDVNVAAGDVVAEGQVLVELV
jgi:acetyl/propionyl-CoA carboxylase alpha subunit